MRSTPKKSTWCRAPVLAGIAMACAAGLPMPASAGGPEAQDGQSRPTTEVVQQLIVKYRNATSATVLDASTLGSANQAATGRNLGLRHERRTALGAHVLRLNQRISLDEANALAQEIQAGDFNVEYAEPNRMMQAQLTPNDTYYASQQWDLFEATAGINVPTAWDTTAGRGVVVAVIDSGYRPHADLVANLVAGYDFVSDATNTRDGDGRDADASDPGDYSAAGECDTIAYNSSWHGTHVAGTIGAVTNNALGIAGIAHAAKVQPVRVLGTCGGTNADIADAIVWASGGSVSGVPANPTPARVINMSLGGQGACSSTVQTAINSALSRNTVVVVAAGNSNANASNYSPASCSGVIAVAAVTRTGARASYSNYGSVVDIAAPGSGIYSTLNAGTSTPVSSANGGDTYASYNGTSMAAPHVAGVAALMLAVNPALTPAEVEARLKSSARAFPVTCSLCGSGLLNATAAVAAAAGTTTLVAEVESNNTRSTAQVITPNPATVTGSLSSSDLNDYFAVTIGAGKTLTARLTPPSTADFDLYLYTSLSGSYATRSVLGTGVVDTVTYANATSAAITVYVQAFLYGGSGTYTLSLSQ